jgi:hypothetical protein
MKYLRYLKWLVALFAASFAAELAYAQAYEPEAPEPVGEFTDAEKAVLKSIDDAIARFDGRGEVVPRFAEGPALSPASGIRFVRFG